MKKNPKSFNNFTTAQVFKFLWSEKSIVLTLSLLILMIFPVDVFSKIDIPGNSPDIIYFILIDRFADGDSTNNSGNNPDSHVPFTGDNYESLKSYQGGDLRGIIHKLEYLKNLGITIIWLSPFLDNSDTDYVGWWAYHGYHPVDFYSVDEHFGTLSDLKELVYKAHSLDMKVLFDMPFNQTAADHPWVNDPDRENWYHFDSEGKPFDITDWYDQEQIERGELHGLPDLAQENKEVYKYLTEAAEYWITETGCDGFRLDAVKHIPLSFWNKFNDEMRSFAGADFMLIEEVFWGEPERIAPYSDAGFTHLFDIPGYYLIRNVFASGGSIKSLSEGLQSSEKLWERVSPVTLIDNHDVARFATGIADHSWDKEKLALSYLFTLPGIPMLYYGTEIGMGGAPTQNPETGEQQDYLNRLPFPDQFDSESQEHLSEVKELIQLRRDYPILEMGNFYEIYKDWGIYGYLRKEKDKGIIVFINTAETVESIKTDFNGWGIESIPELIYGTGHIERLKSVWQVELPPISASVWHVKIDSSFLKEKWVPFIDRLTGDYQIVKFVYVDSTNKIKNFQIAGDFNNWTPTNYNSEIIGDKIVSSVPLRPGTYHYKFVLNGNEWVHDPNTEKFELDPWGGKNSILEVKK